MSEKNPKKLILVAPGIGSEPPGGTLTHFVKTVGVKKNRPYIEELLFVHLEETEVLPDGQQKKQAAVETFIVPIAHLDTDDASMEFREIYWDDLSMVKESLWSILKAIFNLIVGLRFFMPPISENGKEVMSLVWLNNLFFWILRGPVFALNILVLVLILLSTGMHTVLMITKGYLEYEGVKAEFEHLKVVQDALYNWSNILFIGGASLLAILLLYLKDRTKESSFFHTWTSNTLIVCCVLSIVYFVVNEFFFLDRNGMVSLDGLIRILSFLWIVVNLITFSSCMIYFWKRSAMPAHIRPGALMAYISMVLSVMFWALLIPVLYITFYNLVPEIGHYKKLEEFLNKGLPLTGWMWFSMLVLFMFIAYVVFRRNNWIKSNKDNDDPFQTAPRLIFSSNIVRFFLVFAPVLSLFFISVIAAKIGISFFKEQLGFVDNILESIKPVTQILNGLALVMIPLLVPIFFSLKDYFRIALDIALDVLNYFRPSPRQANQGVLIKMNKKKGETWTLNYQIRKKISDRIRKTVEYDLSQFKDKELVIVAHSQGTIFMVDFLANEANKELLDHFSTVYLVTMGSPLSHLYQHYLPGVFGNKSGNALRKELHLNKWKYFYNLHPKITWRNIYRVDDYIGTFIDPPKDVEATLHPKNIKIGARGHTGYFTDEEVWNEVEDLF